MGTVRGDLGIWACRGLFPPGRSHCVKPLVILAGGRHLDSQCLGSSKLVVTSTLNQKAQDWKHCGTVRFSRETELTGGILGCLTGCGPANTTVVVYQNKGKESSSCQSTRLGVSAGRQYTPEPKGVGAYASEGPDLPARTGGQRESKLLSFPVLIQAASRGMAQI